MSSDIPAFLSGFGLSIDLIREEEVKGSEVFYDTRGIGPEMATNWKPLRLVQRGILSGDEVCVRRNAVVWNRTL